MIANVALHHKIGKKKAMLIIINLELYGVQMTRIVCC
jgi:hypothetical protein